MNGSSAFHHEAVVPPTQFLGILLFIDQQLVTGFADQKRKQLLEYVAAKGVTGQLHRCIPV
jgi:hypothetical protein